MGFTTVPTPLWSLYAQRDHFSSFTVTIVFAAYALAVALSLFLAGHLSDWYGRRRVLMPALALNVLAAVVFLLWPALPGLLLARVLSGLGVGAVTATATAWLSDLGAGNRRRGGRRRAQVVATGANLGGLGLGALISGVLAQWAGHPLSVPFAVFLGALLLAWVALLAAPETRAAAIAATELPPAARIRAGGVARPVLRRRPGRVHHVCGLRPVDLARAELPGRDAPPALACAGRRCLVCGVRRGGARADADRFAQRAAVARRGDPGAAARARPVDDRRLAADPKSWRLPRRRSRHRRRRGPDVQGRDRCGLGALLRTSTAPRRSPACSWPRISASPDR